MLRRGEHFLAVTVHFSLKKMVLSDSEEQTRQRKDSLIS